MKKKILFGAAAIMFAFGASYALEETGTTEPTETTEGTETEEGGETDPGEGGETDPGEGGEVDPGEGGETDPGEGGETDPGEGGEVDPGEGEETEEARIVINEVMQSNITNLFVEQDFPDSWVELYNTGSEPVDISGYYIGVKDKLSKCYVLPENTVIEGKGYLLLYCDKVGEGLHTDFRVDSGKGSVYLFNADGELVEQMDLKKMPSPDIAYGRETDAAEEMGYMITPTPGAANAGGVTKTVLPSAVFSQDGGLFTESFELTISLPDEELPEETYLCVTFDGKEPTMENAVEDNTLTMEIDATKVVKAKLLSPDAVSSWSVAHSYIFHGRDITLPVVSLITDPDYLYGDDMGILVEGTYDPNKPNYQYEWRRPVNFEYFDGEGMPCVLNQLTETAVQGGSSRQHPLKSLKIYANKRFGVKRLDYPFWSDKPDVHADVASISLRNSGNDFRQAHIRDGFIGNLFGYNVPDMDYMAYQPAIYYINGEYVGIIDVRERSNEDYVAANYDGLEDIFMIESWWEVKAGETSDLADFGSAMRKWRDVETPYEELEAIVDMEHLLNYFIAEAYFCNQDWPGGNIVIWKDLTNPESKYRFLLKDVDYTCAEATDANYFDYIAGGNVFSYQNINKDSQEFFNRLQITPEITEQLIDRFAVYMGDFLQPECANALLEEMVTQITPEYPYFAEVYGLNPGTWRWYIKNVVGNWVSGSRSDAVYSQLKERYNLGELYELTIDMNGVDVALQDIPLTQPVFNGKFYNGRNLVVGSSVDCIEVTYTDAEGNESLVYMNNSDNAEPDKFVICPTDARAVKIVKHNPNSVDKLNSDVVSDAKLVCDGMIAKVVATEDIQMISLYSADGKLLANACGNSVELPSKGMYLVKAVTSSGRTYTFKTAK